MTDPRTYPGPHPRDVMPLGHRLLRAASEHIRWRDELTAARRGAGANSPPLSRVAAIDTALSQNEAV
jgi:hypothetical protein